MGPKYRKLDYKIGEYRNDGPLIHTLVCFCRFENLNAELDNAVLN